jgi:hypothetical protein
MSTDWCEQEEKYLTELIKICQYMSQRYNLTYLQYKRKQTQMRIPQIILSSISGLFSFGVTAFPPNYSSAVSISVGISSLIVALIGGIESLLKISEILAGSLISSSSFNKLAETITVELALPRHKRSSAGILFVREAHSTFAKITESSPSVYKVVRFVKPYPYDKRAGPSPLDDPSEELTPISMATFEGKSLDNNDTPTGSPAGWRPNAPQRSAIDLPV